MLSIFRKAPHYLQGFKAALGTISTKSHKYLE